MKVSPTNLDGVCVIEPDVFGDKRGFFLETYRKDRYLEEAGLPQAFVQDNHSRSTRGVLRGLHAQRKNPQGKLVRTVRGAVFDVAVDINNSSATYGEWFGAELTDENHRQLWVPPGYAHGFLVLSDIADVEYKCTTYYDPMDEIGVVWNDPQLDIQWPIDTPILSEKDQQLPSLANFLQ